VIRSFTSKSLQALWKRGRLKGIDPRTVERLKRLLADLDAAQHPADMDLPGHRFHPLTGDRQGQYAVTIRANWRLVFEWEGGHAVRVREEDYHGT
jgi:proteic killer suppression protein